MAEVMEAACSTAALLRDGERRLRAVGIRPARREAEWLLAHLLHHTLLELYLRETPVPAAAAEQFHAQIANRASGIPLQYLVRETAFFGEPFTVAPGVFIPRPETEAVVAAALERLRERQRCLCRPLRLLDLGTGSGCIAVTLARQLPACAVVGVEVTWEALHIAQQNVQRHGLAAQVWLVQGRWADAISAGFDGIVSNPPYVPRVQVDRLPREVRHEPLVSLTGGDDGLQELRAVLMLAPRLLTSGGVLALESGEEQVEPLQRLAGTLAWVKTAAPIFDLAGRPRGVIVTSHGD